MYLIVFSTPFSRQRDSTMADPKTLIATAVKVILGEQYVTPVGQDRYFLGDIIIKMSEVLSRDGPPTIEMRNMSIEIGELTRADCQAGHITLTSHDQFGRRDADSLSFIAYNMRNTDAGCPKASEYGHRFDFAVCQACPAFIDAIHKAHTVGFTADTVLERAKAYWIATYGHWA